MKYIKLFIASSVEEFAQERMELSDYIRSLNDIYVHRGFYFDLKICEDLPNALVKERKQDEYNQHIRESEYFYVIFGRNAGDYTIEEFDVALAQFREGGAPKIYTYFRTLPEGESPAKSVTDFMTRLDRELGHYYSFFPHLDTIKLNILMELTRDPELHSTVTLEDGRALLDGHEMLSMENIPLYSKNETVQKLLAEKKELEEEFVALQEMVAAGKSPAFNRLLLENGEKRAKLTEQLHTLEKDVLALYRDMAEKRRLGVHMNWREKEALRLVDAGNYEAAKAVLRDEGWKTELQNAEETVDLALEPIREYISGKRTLIKTISSTGVDSESAAEVRAIYEELTELFRKYGLESDVLYDYASFLWDEKDYENGVKIAESLQGYYQSQEKLGSEVSEDEKARLLNLLGMLKKGCNDFTGAEAAYREALGIRRKLAETHPEAYLPDVAKSANNLAILFKKLRQFAEAEQLFREALGIRRKLVEEYPEVHLPSVALVANNLARLLNDFRQYEEAERLFREALDVRRRLAEAHPEAYLPKVALTANNLAILLTKLRQYAEAEQFFHEALDIQRNLAEAHPEAYLPYVAQTASGLANLLRDLRQFAEAEELYREALGIRRKLAEAHPEAYRPDVAQTANNLANLLGDLRQYAEAEALFREALDIRRKLAEAHPEAYLPDVAQTANNLAILLKNLRQYAEAEELYREALNIHRKLAEAHSEAYLPDVATTANNLANLLGDLRQYAEAEELYREALDIQRDLAEAHPEAYLPDVAMTANNLAILLKNLRRYTEAEELYREALNICRKLAEKYPEAYLPDVAATLHNLALLLDELSRTDEAEASRKEETDIRSRLSQS